MGRISWNVDALRGNVVAPLEQSCDSLIEAGNIISSINIPKNLSCKINFSNMSGEIGAIRDNILRIKVVVLAIALKFEETEYKNEKFLNNLILMLCLDENMRNVFEDLMGEAGTEYTSMNEAEMLAYLQLNGYDTTLSGYGELRGPGSIDDMSETRDGTDPRGRVINDNYERLGTRSAFLASLQELHDTQMDWRYGGIGTNGGLSYSNFEGSINNDNKVTCCATSVACALYNAGYITEEDLTYDGKFNPNLPSNLNDVCENKGYEKITEADELEAGDIVFHESEPGHINHVEVYGGKDEETGETLWYNTGSTNAIQAEAPERRDEPCWDLAVRWWAYRLPDDVEIEE